MGVGQGAAGAGRQSVFVSYAGADRPWAQWAASVLEEAGYAVELDVWDWAAGENAVLRMSDALARADQVLALWSQAYFERDRFTTDEWTPLLAERPGPDGHRRRLVPVRVQAVDPPGVLRQVIFRDLFGLDETRARAELLAALAGPSGRGLSQPFPGGPAGQVGAVVGAAGVRVPGSLPVVWNVPARNLGFTGRQRLLAELHERLTGAGGGRVWVQALNGIGGVGKTQTAIEYAHLFAGEYDHAWWIDAEQVELIPEQLASLAVEAGWVPRTIAVGDAIRVAGARLRQMGRWLVVFDNVEDPAAVKELVPQGPGQVIITSRHRAWTGVAAPVGVEVFTRAESIALLATHLPALMNADADAVAEAVGDLPLALAQAAGLLAETAMPVPEYLTELAQHTRETLGESVPAGYPRSLVGTIALAVDRLRRVDPAAVEVLRLTAVLAPEPVPLGWFTTPAAGSLLPEVVRPVVRRGLAWRRTLGRVADLGLATVTDGDLVVHRLTQAILRDARTPAQLIADHQTAAQMLAAAAPTDPGENPGTWPSWAALLPHLLALDPATTPALHYTGRQAQWYLLMRGDYTTALPLAHTWREAWKTSLGPDHPDTLHIADQLAATYRYLGRAQEARDLHQATLEALQRVLGPDHPDTLTTASNLTLDLTSLGYHQEARDLGQTTFDAQRRVLGPDHPDTLTSAHYLAENLCALGRHQEALDLNQANHETRLRILGPDHPRTLTSANNLANDLSALGRHQEAFDVNQANHETRQRILGPDHPNTLNSAYNLARDLSALGRYQEAHDLSQATHQARRRVQGPDHPDTLTTANGLARDLSALGRYQEAHDLSQATHEALQRVLGPDHPDTLSTAHNLANGLRALGRIPEAGDLHRSTYRARQRVLGPDHPDTLSTADNLALDLRALGRSEEAQALEIDIRDRRHGLGSGDGPGPGPSSSSTD